VSSPLHALLQPDPPVVAAGVELLADAIRAQGGQVTTVDWRPPVRGTQAALAAVAADPRTPEANVTAVSRMLAARPHAVDVRPAREVVPGLNGRTLLHAGPPLDWADASGPMRGAVIGALLYEGWADTPEDAEQLAARGGVALDPCHHHGMVGPMAGVVSPTMPVWVGEDFEHGGAVRCTLNEGLGKVLRYGAYSQEVVDRLRWMDNIVGPLLGEVLRRRGPLDLRALIAQALQMGDEGHNRNRAGTSLLVRELAPELVASGWAAHDIADVLRFVNGNDHFFLNLVMPACKAAADAARNIPGSTMVVAMARNGTTFGVQTSGTGDEWFTAPATVPDGLYLPGYVPDDANPDIGDSTITETAGIGGLAMAAAPAIVRFVGGEAGDALAKTLAMYDITLAEHNAWQIPILEFRGTPTGLDVALVVRTGILPSVNTGIAGKEAGTGQVGAGLVTPPMECFADAVRALAGRAHPP
jgi:hypothetical protein